jgi:hypothetical protein
VTNRTRANLRSLVPTLVLTALAVSVTWLLVPASVHVTNQPTPRVTVTVTRTADDVASYNDGWQTAKQDDRQQGCRQAR